ncbi:hypothetical protein [Curtobacterium sp. MCPF17_052]|uniref:hypothetical protein n=1 Tax=Curtobacterium sp. MCPF17_052 TaxID=2175655 RepID=UPI0024DF8345|nr:hypothetical protein [Curtobacterium sp. MCPF17_052]WIB13564.1 hypothetical protein DEJ36_07380 [Curtobacterium sp. MCPF17_052]
MTHWWDAISLRTKITGITVLLVALGLLVAGLGTMTVLSTYLMRQLDTQVTTTSSQLEGQNVSDGEQYCKLSMVLEKSSYVAAYDGGGEQICDTQSPSQPDVSHVRFSSAASTAAPLQPVRQAAQPRVACPGHPREPAEPLHRGHRDRVRPRRGLQRRYRPDHRAVHRHLPAVRHLGDPARGDAHAPPRHRHVRPTAQRRGHRRSLRSR